MSYIWRRKNVFYLNRLEAMEHMREFLNTHHPFVTTVFVIKLCHRLFLVRRNCNKMAHITKKFNFENLQVLMLTDLQLGEANSCHLCPLPKPSFRKMAADDSMSND